MVDGVAHCACRHRPVEGRHAGDAQHMARDELVGRVHRHHQAERQAVELEVSLQAARLAREVAEEPERQQEGDRRADVHARLRQHLHQRLHALADVGFRPGGGSSGKQRRQEQQAEDADRRQQERQVLPVGLVLGERHCPQDRRAQELQIDHREGAPRGPENAWSVCTQIRTAARAEVAAGGRAAIGAGRRCLRSGKGGRAVHGENHLASALC